MGVVIIIIGLLTLFWSDVIFAFIYNKMYVKNLIGEGFKVSSTTIPEEQMAAKLGMALPKL